jgi:hypothetical protein
VPNTPRRRPPRQTNLRKPNKLRATLAPTLPATVPTRWVKFVVALFLLAPAWIVTETFFTSFARAAVHAEFWRSEEFWFFGCGFVIWLAAWVLFSNHRPLIVYVFGHELTHAIWVILHGGKVSAFRITRSGGHILSDRINTTIALSPYFFPIYSVFGIVIYALLGCFWDMTPWRPLLYMYIGASWSFHLTFTLWMIPRGQTDLTYGGNFYSGVVIYIMNLVVLSVFLIAAPNGLTLRAFARELRDNTVDFARFVVDILHLLHG